MSKVFWKESSAEFQGTYFENKRTFTKKGSTECSNSDALQS